MGYAGGTAPDPTYASIGDHTECFQVDFDPDVVSYAKLVDLAFAAHDPSRPAHKAQYASLVLAHDDEQLVTARERAARVSGANSGRVLTTRIETLRQFWPAEEYHQKYHLKQDRVLASEFVSMFGDDLAALRESTAAARINAYIAGYGTQGQLAREIDFLGLSEKGRAHLVSKVMDDAPSGSCAIGAG